MQVKQIEDETGEMTQWLKPLAALAELSVTLAPWVLSPLVGSAGTACLGYTYMHEGKLLIHIKI